MEGISIYRSCGLLYIKVYHTSSRTANRNIHLLMPPPKPEDDDVYFIHLVADDKLVIDAALGPLKDSKLILSHEKNGGNNQKVSGFESTSCSVS